eukprot:2281719-Prymnesium_polylepis.2
MDGRDPSTRRAIVGALRSPFLSGSPPDPLSTCSGCPLERRGRRLQAVKVLAVAPSRDAELAPMRGSSARVACRPSQRPLNRD